MVEVQQLRVQKEVDSMVKRLERPTSGRCRVYFRCSASCCGDTQVHRCIERCHALLAQAQALAMGELEKFQDCLAQYTMHCNDKVKDSLDAGSKELQVKRRLENCVTKCVDDHIHLIPTMTKKMKESLSFTENQKSVPQTLENKGKSLFEREKWEYSYSKIL
ncbi:protein FAM136A-like [Sorex fumeus]|uniref:protein FAM136A-like n=1 Tax=Sorex fumeus TaxID=62283 RepID=UPI0024AE77F9|nr:protein FAM136A-like [Sorex fumeus]